METIIITWGLTGQTIITDWGGQTFFIAWGLTGQTLRPWSKAAGCCC